MRYHVLFIAVILAFAGCTGDGDPPQAGTDDNKAGDAPMAGSDATPKAGTVPKAGDDATPKAGTVPKAGDDATPKAGTVPKAGGDSAPKAGGGPAPSTGTGILSDMATAMSAGTPYECEYRFEEGSGRVWIDGEKYHSMVDSQGQNVNSLSDGVWVYTWMRGEKQGQKIKLADMEELGEDSDEMPEYDDVEGIQASAVDVSCKPISRGSHSFVPDRSVEFMDMGQLLAMAAEMGEPDSGVDLCQFCSMIPDAAEKAQCMADCGKA